MARRLAWLLASAVAIGGCEQSYFYREPCDASAAVCCPPNSHQVAYELDPTDIICASDKDDPLPDADATVDVVDGGIDAP